MEQATWRIEPIEMSAPAQSSGEGGGMPGETRLALMAPLAEDTIAKGFFWNPESLVLGLFQGDQVTPQGGLIGQILWGWLRVEILAVPKVVRGQGWGRRLMVKAEEIAIERGCHSAWVDTFSFQAPGFYEKLGYQPFGRLEDYPPGHQRWMFQKKLSQPPQPQR